MARKTATEDGHPPPPQPPQPPPRQPNKPIPKSDRKRKRLPGKEVPADEQPIRKRKQIPYQTSTQTLKVGSYPTDNKGNKGVIGTNTSHHKKKQACAKKGTKKSLPTETESDDDFVTETLSDKGRGKAKKESAADGQSTRYKGFETRTTPNTLTEAVMTLTDQQKVAVGSMGLDGMLNLAITYVPTQFATWLLEAFNSKSCKLVTPRGDAKILPKDTRK